MNKKKISIITPCYNEETIVLTCYETIKQLFSTVLINYTYEHIFCDNASTDNTASLLKTIAENDLNIKLIVNSRNFGILKNTYNGVINATGDAVLLFMPVDMQDPPELIPTFIQEWEKGYEIVYGIRAEREENIILASVRKLYYRLLGKLTYVNYPVNVGDFQLIDKCVLDVMKKIDDARPFMRLMTFDCGFKSTGISYKWTKRKQGKSKNSLANMFDQGLNGLVSFSSAPLRLSLFIGMIIAGVSLTYAITLFFMTLFGIIKAPSGIPTLIIAIFFFSGIQLFFLGILGEYIFAIFNQVRRKPLVVERERVNF